MRLRLVWATSFVILAAIVGTVLLRQTSRTSSAVADPIAQRVLRSGNLRVGYLIEPPYLTRSGADGHLSGIFYDLTEELGKRLNLKVKWVEEVNLATLSSGLDAGRFDMVAFSLWRNATRSKQMSFSTPIFYSILSAYARVNDVRFDKGLGAVNSPAVRIASIDGELSEDIAHTDYPKATLSSLPQLSDYSQMLLEVADRKADVTFFNRVLAARFIRQNPGTLRDISGGTPIRVYAECFVLPLGDPTFRDMINAALLELLENGVVDNIFRSNGENPDEYYRPALPYRLPAVQ